jgi:hypothetical protein
MAYLLDADWVIQALANRTPAITVTISRCSRSTRGTSLVSPASGCMRPVDPFHFGPQVRRAVPRTARAACSPARRPNTAPAISPEPPA